MKRLLYKSLLNWKQQSKRKPLIVQGARQVGKTYLLEQFGQAEFPKYHLFDFMASPSLCQVFERDFNVSQILQDLSLYADQDISLEEDLIIFDEIQACPAALTRLKYFQKECPAAYICASGSLLGIGLADSPFPVGKVDRVYLYPMTFFEFLLAIGQERLLSALTSARTSTEVSPVVHEKTWRHLKNYFVTGGLPEVVATFVDQMDKLHTAFSSVRELQAKLVRDYIDDIAKHSGKVKALDITAVFKNVPIQLARETIATKKYIFKDVLPASSKYATLREPIDWLIMAGLVHKVPICKRCRLPLQAYTDANKFNLYLFDIGILGVMIDLSFKSIMDYDYGSYKGYFAENYVLQELTAQWNKVFYSWSENTASIEFLMDLEGQAIPIEVKAQKSTKAKSLRVFAEKYAPRKAVLFSGKPLKLRDSMQDDYPLYMVSEFPLD